MKLFTSVTAKLTQDLQDILCQNTDKCLSESATVQELVSRTGLMLIQTGSVWELVGDIQSVCSAYVALARLLDNEFSICIENLKLEDVIPLKTAGATDFLNSALNSAGESESRSDEDVGVNEDTEHARKRRKTSRKVPEPVVLSINADDIGGYQYHDSERVKSRDSLTEYLSEKEVKDQSLTVEMTEKNEKSVNSTKSIEGGRKKLRTSLKRVGRKRVVKNASGNSSEKSAVAEKRPKRREAIKEQFYASNNSHNKLSAKVTKICERGKKEEQEGDSEIVKKQTQTESQHINQSEIEEKIHDLRQGHINEQGNGINEFKEYDSLNEMDVTKNDNLLYKKVEKQWLRDTDTKAQNIPCQIKDCAFVGKLKQNAIEHYARMHSVRNLKCKCCDTYFSLFRDLKRHLKHHNISIRCEKCGKLYKSERSFKEHQKTHQEDFVKPLHECETCGKKFSTKYVLQYHIKSEHMGIKKSFICPTCGKSFTQKQSYTTHANVHMGLRPFVCEVCGVSFPYEKSLREHKYMHDEHKNFKCEICGKQFKQPSALCTHQKIHKETKDHLCKVCGKGFTQRQALLRHERVHSGDKPFTCNICFKNFNDASIIRRHLIMVHKANPKDWKSFTLNDTPRQTNHFVQVLSGELQPQLKKRQKTPNHMVTTQESTTNDVQAVSQLSLVTSTDSRAHAALALTSMASHGSVLESSDSVNSSEHTPLETNIVSSHGPINPLSQPSVCPPNAPSVLTESQGETSLYNNYPPSLPSSSFNSLQSGSDVVEHREQANATHLSPVQSAATESLLYQYMNMSSTYSHYNANQ